MKTFLMILITLILTGSAQAGCLNGNCENGMGTFLLAEDSGFFYYSGEFKNGVPDGAGTAKKAEGNTMLEYTGGFKCGKFDGKGVLTDSFGRRLEGRFKNGKYLGK